MAKGDQIKGFLGNFIKQFFKNEPSEQSKEILEKASNTKFIKPFKVLNKEARSGFFNQVFGFYTGYNNQSKVDYKTLSDRIAVEFNEETTTLSSKLSDLRKDINDLKLREGKIKKYQTNIDSLNKQIADLEAKAKDAPAQTNNNVKYKKGRKNGGKNKTTEVIENKQVNNTTDEQPNYTDIIKNLKNKIEKNNKEINKNKNLNNEFKQNVNELLKGKLFKKGSQISNEATSEDIAKIVDEAENFIDLLKPENRHKNKVEAWFDWIIQFDYEQSKTSERAQVQAGRISKTVAKAVVTQSIPQIMNGTQSFLSGKDKEQEYPQFGVMGQPMSYRDKLIRMVGNATQGV